MTVASTQHSKIVVLGAGSWGLTLAWLAASQEGEHRPKEVVLWSRNPEKVARLRGNRQLNFPVPVTLPDSLVITSELGEAIVQADAVILVVTSRATISVAQQVVATGKLHAKTAIINASKGLDPDTLLPLSQALKQVLPEGQPIAVVSGPTLAKEILNGLPTACSLAVENQGVAQRLQTVLTCHKRFRLYTNTDVLGVELGGALKNIFAIASGYMAAKKLGDNARAALITRGLAEMTRLSLAMGAEAETLYGLSGLGDLLATCYSPLSRNYQVGYRLGNGEVLQAILDDLQVVAEGIPTTYAVCKLGRKLGIETPIADMVQSFLEGQCVSEEAMIQGLMSRKLKSEKV